MRMTPDLYTIQYASTPEEILNVLERCVVYVRSGPILALLPDELQGLQVRDKDDVEAWRRRLEHALNSSSVLTASARCWVAELAEVFSMAGARLHAVFSR